MTANTLKVVPKRGVDSVTAITGDEKALLRNFRQADALGRRMVSGLAEHEANYCASQRSGPLLKLIAGGAG